MAPFSSSAMGFASEKHEDQYKTAITEVDDRCETDGYKWKINIVDHVWYKVSFVIQPEPLSPRLLLQRFSPKRNHAELNLG